MSRGDIHIMADLETLGTQPNSVVTSIGAARIENDDVVDLFHERIDFQNCLDLGLEIDAKTLKWWLGQSDQAQEELKGETDLFRVLDRFDNFCRVEDKHDQIYMWGNGASFDCVLLENLYLVTNRQPPFHWWNSRCFRTLKAMCPVEHEFIGTQHNAQEDAYNQAMQLLKISDQYNITL